MPLSTSVEENGPLSHRQRSIESCGNVFFMTHSADKVWSVTVANFQQLGGTEIFFMHLLHRWTGARLVGLFFSNPFREFTVPILKLVNRVAALS